MHDQIFVDLSFLLLEFHRPMKMHGVLIIPGNVHNGLEMIRETKKNRQKISTYLLIPALEKFISNPIFNIMQKTYTISLFARQGNSTSLLIYIRRTHGMQYINVRESYFFTTAHFHEVY